MTAILESNNARNGARCVPSRGNGAFGPLSGALGPHMQTTVRPAGAQRSGPDRPVQQQVAADEHPPLVTSAAAGCAGTSKASDCSSMATTSRERIGMIIDRSPYRVNKSSGVCYSRLYVAGRRASRSQGPERREEASFDPWGKVERLVAAHPIPGDANALLAVNIQDFLAVLAAWGHCTGCGEEFDHDGMVGNSDLRIVLANWGR